MFRSDQPAAAAGLRTRVLTNTRPAAMNPKPGIDQNAHCKQLIDRLLGGYFCTGEWLCDRFKGLYNNIWIIGGCDRFKSKLWGLEQICTLSRKISTLTAYMYVMINLRVLLAASSVADRRYSWRMYSMYEHTYVYSLQIPSILIRHQLCSVGCILHLAKEESL